MNNEFLDFFSALRASHAQNETFLEDDVDVAKVPLEASVLPATSGEVEDVESPSTLLPSNHESLKDKFSDFNIDNNIPVDDRGRDINTKDSPGVQTGKPRDKDRHSSLPGKQILFQSSMSDHIVRQIRYFNNSKVLK